MKQPGELVIAVTVAGCLLAGCGEESPQKVSTEGMQQAAGGDEQVEGGPAAAFAAGSATAGLTVTNVTFCSSEPRGYGNYQEQPGATYRAGQTAWIYLDVANIEARTGQDGQIENSLRQSIKLRDPWGRLLMQNVVVDEVRPIDKYPDRLFLQNQILIPSGAPAGEYRVELLVEDRFAGAKTQASGRFTVTP